MPPFIIENPDAMNAFKKYGVGNLKDLSVEMMHMYVLETLIPIMMARVENKAIDEAPEDVQHGMVADQQPSQNTKDFLKSYGLHKVSMSTVLRWMHTVGFRYKTRSNKHYFVDGHEKPETLAYRPVFTKQYLAHEGQAH